MSESTAVQSPSSSADGVKWDLGDLYQEPAGPGIEKDQSGAEEEAVRFSERYRGKIGGLSPEQLAAAMAQWEAISEQGARPLIHAQLRFAADTAGAGLGATFQRAKERHTAVMEQLIFVELEWQAVPEARARESMDHPALSGYRHMLEKIRRETPYTLSEPEEKLLAVKNNTGRSAFMRLFDEQVSGLRCSFAPPDAPAREVSLEEALAELYGPHRERRIAAARAVTETLRPNLRMLAYILNTLAQDHADNDRLRQRPHMMLARNLSNEITQPGVDALLEACGRGNALVARYYHLKRRLLGLESLYDYDRYAPVFTDLPSSTFAEAQQTVLEAYQDFSPEMADIAGRFFKGNWIDAELRTGKSGGAFSAGTIPSAHPYIMLNYTDTMRDVMTLAHELGHGVHQYLSRARGFFQMDTPLTTAETASVFGEMLVFKKLMATQSDPKARLGLICGKLEGIFATVFRQAAMTRFEQKVHTARREQGELEPAAIGALWMEVNRPMFGDALELTGDYADWWAYIPHFIHSPFYCYAYSFGELLVLALFSRYEQEGKAFVPRYLELLAAGGSQSPAALLSRLGMDIEHPGFWNQGITLIEEMVATAESLAEDIPGARADR